MSAIQKLWLTPAEAAGVIGDKPDAIYRDIREGQFPFEFVRIGKRIKISARSLGLVFAPSGVEKNEAQEGDQSLATTTPAHA